MAIAEVLSSGHLSCILTDVPRGAASGLVPQSLLAGRENAPAGHGPHTPTWWSNGHLSPVSDSG